MKTIKLLDSETNTTIAKNLKIASGFFSRAIGLLGKKSINSDFGLMFPKCRSIHTHFMMFSIDIILLDHHHCITELYSNLKPWKLFFAKDKRSCHIIEMAGGTIERLNLGIGNQLELK